MIKFTLVLGLLVSGFVFLIKLIKASTKISTEAKEYLVKTTFTVGFAVILASITLFIVVLLF